MSFNPWTHDQVQQLIEEYKQHPILYSVKNKYYHNRKFRSIALKEILKKIKTIRSETTENDIVKKINGLRTSYGHERRKQMKSIESADSEIYQPTLWYYDMLSFLNGNIMTREKYKDGSDESRNGEEGPKGRDEAHGFSDALDSGGYQSMSTSDPLSEPDIENEIKFFEETEPPLKRGKSCGDKTEYSPDGDDNAWLHYLSTLLGQIKDSQNKVILRHRITKLLYEEIEKQFCDNT